MKTIGKSNCQFSYILALNMHGQYNFYKKKFNPTGLPNTCLQSRRWASWSGGPWSISPARPSAPAPPGRTGRPWGRWRPGSRGQRSRVQKVNISSNCHLLTFTGLICKGSSRFWRSLLWALGTNGSTRLVVAACNTSIYFFKTIN